jgi:hypothetical protein
MNVAIYNFIGMEWLPPIRNVMQSRVDKFGLLIVLAIAVLACALVFALEAHLGFSLWDEGYLWYGVQHVLQGEVPIRDFMSYDPGRYEWTAALLRLFNVQGIVAIRAATAAFSAIGVLCAVWVVWREAERGIVTQIGLSVLAMFLIVSWMVPWWKQYDDAISIILTVSLAQVLKKASARHFFAYGMIVGVAAIFGRNHGVYGVIACALAVMLLLVARQKPGWLICIGMWISGVVIGFSPILIGCAIDHRFAAMFWDSVRFLLEYKGTNLPLPIPWPWHAAAGAQTGFAAIRPFLVGCFFIALPAFCIIGLVVILISAMRRRNVVNPTFAACVITAIPYLNVAFSRADINHLAQAIHPFLMGCLIWPCRGRAGIMVRGIGLLVLAIATLSVALPMHPAYAMRGDTTLQQVNVRGDSVWMDAATAASVRDIEVLAREHVPAGGTVLSVPVWPGAYALLGIKSPVYEIYPLFPRNEQFQDQEIARLRRVNPSMVLFPDVAVDGREDLRYVRTHARIWDYVSNHYHPIGSPDDEPSLKVYLRDGDR